MNQALPAVLHGHAAALPIANLDTDQIMPKQFLHGIDKSGLAAGLLHDLRFDASGAARPGFVLNRAAFAITDVLIAGPNYGCGSSREHAVWGMQQAGFKAVIAAGFGEIFYSNAANNGLPPVTVAPEVALALLDEAAAHDALHGTPLPVSIDLAQLRVTSPRVQADFTLSPRHQRMLLDGLDLIGASLAHRAAIKAFAARHWAAQPWVKDVARRTQARLTAAGTGLGG